MAFLSFARRTPSAEPVPAADATGAVYRLDTIGQVCPFPLVEAKRAINPLDSGDQLQIDFDCTQALIRSRPGPRPAAMRSPSSRSLMPPPGGSPFRKAELSSRRRKV